MYQNSGTNVPFCVLGGRRRRRAAERGPQGLLDSLFLGKRRGGGRSRRWITGLYDGFGPTARDRRRITPLYAGFGPTAEDRRRISPRSEQLTTYTSILSKAGG